MSLSDNEQYNRIFIIGVTDCSQEDIRDAFEPFGQITDIYIPRGKSRVKASKFMLIISDIHSIFFVLFHQFTIYDCNCLYLFCVVHLETCMTALLM